VSISHIEYLKFHYPSVYRVIHTLGCMNYTSIDAYITCKRTNVLTNLESIDVAYANNGEPVCNNYKSINVAYKKKYNSVQTIYKNINCWVLCHNFQSMLVCVLTIFTLGSFRPIVHQECVQQKTLSIDISILE
jgi:hypothetical protein